MKMKLHITEESKMLHKSKRRIDLEKDNIECIWTELKLNKRSLLLGNIYRLPNATTAFFNDLEAMLEKVATRCKGVVLMGDLNINLLTESGLAERIDLLASKNSLIQLVSIPTRITNQTMSLLDVLYTTTPDLFLNTGSVDYTNSDHLMIYTEYVQEVKPQPKMKLIRSFKRCNKEALMSDLTRAPGI